MPAASDPTPIDYARVFDSDPAGQHVLEHLVKRYGGGVFVKGGHEGDRETCFRAGARSVLDFILAQIDRANGSTDPNDQET